MTESSESTSKCFPHRSWSWPAFPICSSRPRRPTILLHPLLLVLPRLEDQLQKPCRGASLPKHVPLSVRLVWCHLHHEEHLGDAQVKEAQHQAAAGADLVTHCTAWSLNIALNNELFLCFQLGTAFVLSPDTCLQDWIILMPWLLHTWRKWSTALVGRCGGALTVAKTSSSRETCQDMWRPFISLILAYSVICVRKFSKQEKVWGATWIMFTRTKIFWNTTSESSCCLSLFAIHCW